MSRPTVEERFWSKVASRNEGECWLWIGAKNAQGYGHLSINGAQFKAHRWSFQRHVGLIPDGFQIDHLCRVRNCVNPAHLDAVSAAENTLRAVPFRGPASVPPRRSTCGKGHEFTPENTASKRPGKSHWRMQRACKTCARIRDAARYRNRQRQFALKPTTPDGLALSAA